MKPAVAIFVKTPGLSPVKTRLGRGVGRRIAEEWHRRAAACVRASAGATGLPVYWAIAEEEGLGHQLWRDFPAIYQGQGGLGTRMARVHAEIVQRHGAGILIGADLPQIETRHLETAATWLQSVDDQSVDDAHVLGPARDGGFWLYGSNRVLPARIWESIRYSRSDTARSLIAAIDAPCWQLLERLTDLDRASDLPTVLAELESVSDPSAQQRELARWIELQIDRAA